MKFLDINTFFTPKGGGIKTYHTEKIKWFKQHPEHKYIVCYPSARPKEIWISPNITLIGCTGIPLTSDPEGYRLLFNYFKVYKTILKNRPDFIEIGDPWLSTLFAWLAPLPKKSVLLSFWHTDAESAYFQPWANSSSIFKFLKIPIAYLLSSLIHRGQRKFDAVICTTHVMANKLRTMDIPVLYAPFGADPVFFKIGQKRLQSYSAIENQVPMVGTNETKHFQLSSPVSSASISVDSIQKQNGPIHPELKKILYAGRLDEEKDMNLFFKFIQTGIQQGFSFTIAGRGKCEPQLKNLLPHPQIHYLGYVSEPRILHQLYQDHLLFLATGPAETFGIGILQALAAGCVVIGSPNGGAGELLKKASTLNFNSSISKFPPLYVSHTNLSEVFKTLGQLNLENLQLRSRASFKMACEFGSWDEAMSRQNRIIQSYFETKLNP